MTSILDMPQAGSSWNIWAQVKDFFLPLKQIITNDRFDVFFEKLNFDYLTDAVFWLFIAYSCAYVCFNKFLQAFLRSSTNMRFYKRKQFVRSLWNIAFFAACALFLYFYNEFMIRPELYKNQGRYSLFYSSEHLIFSKSQHCQKFQFYSMFIITFYLHSAILDLKEGDVLEAVSKAFYLLSLVALDYYKYEYYFVGLNLYLSIYHIITEWLQLLALHLRQHKVLVYRIFLCVRFASWSHIFISLAPFKYLLPTLFSKSFKMSLNVLIWCWYSISIWNSPVLQYFYHQSYHTTPQDCSGEGSAAMCILIKDSNEHRHYVALRKAYLEVKADYEKRNAANAVQAAAGSENTSAKAFQAIKCIMTLKRKLKRIREGRGAEVDVEDDNDDVGTDC